jgi:hypothetical protein
MNYYLTYIGLGIAGGVICFFAFTLLDQLPVTPASPVTVAAACTAFIIGLLMMTDPFALRKKKH